MYCVYDRYLKLYIWIIITLFLNLGSQRPKKLPKDDRSSASGSKSVKSTDSKKNGLLKAKSRDDLRRSRHEVSFSPDSINMSRHQNDDDDDNDVRKSDIRSRKPSQQQQQQPTKHRRNDDIDDEYHQRRDSLMSPLADRSESRYSPRDTKQRTMSKTRPHDYDVRYVYRRLRGFCLFTQDTQP